MYPTLSDFLKDVFGINVPLPIQSYGFMFALAFIFGTLVFAAEFKRKAKNGQLLPFYINRKIGEPAKPQQLFWTFILMFILGFKAVEAALNYSEFVENPQDMILSWRGNFIGGIVIAVLSTVYYWWNKNRKKLDKPKVERKKTYPNEIVGNMLIFVGLWGLVGAKVFDVIQPQNISNFLENPFAELLSFSGLTFYGGIITGFAAGIYYIRKYNLNVLHSIDAFAPAGALAYAVGRIGCQVSGDGCWGIENTADKPDWLSVLPNWAWSYDYPNNVLGVNLENPVFPTPLYETTMMFIAFIILWSLRKHIKIPGFLFALYLIFAGLERFFIEFIRVTEKYSWIGLSQAQIISVFMVIVGLAAIIYMFIDKQKFMKLGKTKIKPINLKEPQQENKEIQKNDDENDNMNNDKNTT